MPDYKLSVRLLGDDSNLQKAFANAEKTVSDFESRTNSFSKRFDSIGASLVSTGKKLTKYITTPAIGATTALTSLTLVKGFNRLTGIDDAKAKLKGLGHDAKSIETIMNSALSSVKGTSYGMDEAATTAAGAVAAGIKPGKSLTRYLSLTADAAAEAGISMADMGSIINKVQTNQVAYTENLQQLADRGLPIYQWIGDAAGVTADKVKDMAKDGEISSEMFLNAIEKNIGGAAKIIGENSFKATITNIGASIGRIGANFLDAGGTGGGFFSTLKPLLVDFNNNLSVLESKATELGQKFGQAFQSIVDKVMQLKEHFQSLDSATQSSQIKLAGVGAVLAAGMGPGLTVLGNGIKLFNKADRGITSFAANSITSMKQFPATMTKVGTSVGGFVSDLKAIGGGMMQPFTPLITGISQKVMPFVSKVKSGFANVGSFIAAPFKNGFKFVSNGLSNLVGQFGMKFPKLAGAIGVFENASKGMFSKIGGGVTSLGSKVLSFAPMFMKGFNIAAGVGIVFAVLGLLQGQFGEQIDQILNIATTKGPMFIANLVEGIVSKIPSLVALGGTLIGNLLNAIISNLSVIIGCAALILSTLVTSIAGQLPTLIPIAIDLLLTLVNSLITNLPLIISAGLELLVGFVDGILMAIPVLLSSAPTLIVNLISCLLKMAPKIITTGITLVTKLAVGLIQAIPQLISAVPKLIEELRSSFADFDWGSIGRNIIDGIKEGLSSVASSLVQSAKDAGQAALDGIKSILKIHSPSRVFRDEVGKMMALGLGIGFEHNIPVKLMTSGVSDAVSGITSASMYSVADAGVGLSGVTTHMIEDVSLNYATGIVSSNTASNGMDTDNLGEYIVSAVAELSDRQADALQKGISSIRMMVNNREAGRFISALGFVRG